MLTVRRYANTSMPIPRQRPFEPDSLRTPPFEHWRLVARERLQDERRAHSGEPRASVRVTPGFFALVALTQLFALRFALHGAAATVIVLPSLLLVHELPRTLVLRALGRSSSTTISASGADTKIAPGLPRSGVLSLAILGCLGNLALAGALAKLAQHVAPEVAVLTRHAAVAHAAWAALQALPLVPFRLGRYVAARLPTRLRALHAAASLACVAFLGSLLDDYALGVALFPIIVLGAVGSARALVEAAQERQEEEVETQDAGRRRQQGRRAPEPGRDEQHDQEQRERDRGVAELRVERRSDGGDHADPDECRDVTEAFVRWYAHGPRPKQRELDRQQPAPSRNPAQK